MRPDEEDVVVEDSLELLWYTFSAAWVAYLVFVLSVSARQKRIWQQIRDLRARLGNVKP